MRCHFCAATVADVPAAVDADWAPGYYDERSGVEESAPTCPDCQRKHLWIDHWGELVLPDHGKGK